jgi:hypothetical protein
MGARFWRQWFVNIACAILDECTREEMTNPEYVDYDLQMRGLEVTLFLMCLEDEVFEEPAPTSGVRLAA